jgi:hypothetical protein
MSPDKWSEKFTVEFTAPSWRKELEWATFWQNKAKLEHKLKKQNILNDKFYTCQSFLFDL